MELPPPDIPEQPEGTVPLYSGEAGDPDRKHIGWFRVADQKVFLEKNFAVQLFQSDINNLSLHVETSKEKTDG